MKHIRTSRDPESWGLPEAVARERGYFEDEGLSVEFVDEDLSCELPETVHGRAEAVDVKERQFLGGEVDTYSVCQWGSLTRTHELGTGTVVAVRERVNFTHAIYPGRGVGVEDVADLAGVPIGVNHQAGSYFAAFEALEDHLPEEDVVVTHVGGPQDRFRALYRGEVDAVSLMEPYQTLAERAGFRKLVESPARGARVAADGVDESDVRAFVRAFNRAAEEINAHPERYRDAYLERLAIDTEVLDLVGVDLETLRQDIEVPRYDGYELVGDGTLDATFEWMRSHELIDDDADLRELAAGPP